MLEYLNLLEKSFKLEICTPVTKHLNTSYNICLNIMNNTHITTKKIDVIKTKGDSIVHHQIRLMNGLVFMRLKSRRLRIDNPSNIGVCNEEETSRRAS